MNDWRLTGQDEYMKNVKLKLIVPSEIHKKDSLWHVHCEFCMRTIDNSYKESCYCTLDNYRWICTQCYNDFKEMFNWTVVNDAST